MRIDSNAPNNELAVLMTYSVNIVVIAQKKHLQVSLVDQKEAPSSRENSTPPIGAPKAAATPDKGFRPGIDDEGIWNLAKRCGNLPPRHTQQNLVFLYHF